MRISTRIQGYSHQNLSSLGGKEDKNCIWIFTWQGAPYMNQRFRRKADFPNSSQITERCLKQVLYWALDSTNFADRKNSVISLAFPGQHQITSLVDIFHPEFCNLTWGPSCPKPVHTHHTQTSAALAAHAQSQLWYNGTLQLRLLWRRLWEVWVCNPFTQELHLSWISSDCVHGQVFWRSDPWSTDLVSRSSNLGPAFSLWVLPGVHWTISWIPPLDQILTLMLWLDLLTWHQICLITVDLSGDLQY